MFQRNSLSNEATEAKCDTNLHHAPVQHSYASKYVGLVDSEHSRVIKEEEYSACVALLDMASSPGSSFPTKGSPPELSPNSSARTSPTAGELSQDFLDFFPHYSQAGTSSAASVSTEIKSEPLLENGQQYRNSLVDHDYHAKEEFNDCKVIVKSENITFLDCTDFKFKERFIPNNEEHKESTSTSEKGDSEKPVHQSESIETANFHPVITDLDQCKAASALNLQFVPNCKVSQASMSYTFVDPTIYSDYNAYFYPQQQHGIIENANYGNANQLIFGQPFTVNSINESNHDPYGSMSNQVGVHLGSEMPENIKGIDYSTIETNHLKINSTDDKFNKSYKVHYDVENKENLPDIWTGDAMQEINVKYAHQRFPAKVWNLASDEEFAPIRWSDDGKSLIIDELSLEPCLGFLFRSKKFSSFLRQLHLYGFRKMTRSRVMRTSRLNEKQPKSYHVSEYQCQYFQRDCFDLLKQVRRFYNPPQTKCDLSSDSLSLPSSPLTAASTASLASSTSSPLTSSVIYSSPANSEDDFGGGKSEYLYQQHYYQNEADQLQVLIMDETSRSSIETTASVYYELTEPLMEGQQLGDDYLANDTNYQGPAV